VENTLFCNVKESFKTFLDPGVDDFQNLINFSVSKNASLVQF